MKFAHMIFCGLAAFAVPVAASAKDATTQPTAATTAPVSTLFQGTLDMPVAEGSNVPSDCQFPESLQGASVELACIVADEGAAEDEINIEYVSWLGENGFRHSADLIGGIAAARETENGCEQVLRIYPHGEENEVSGIWFALETEPHCAAPTQTP